MYVTRPLSLYRKNPSALSKHPPGDGPYAGILVVKDEESEEQDTYCWGGCERKSIKAFPFPQDKIVSVYHAPPDETTTAGGVSIHSINGGGRIVSTHCKVWFLPVLNQPLSSNLYYVIRAKGQYKGKACVSAKGADGVLWSCCCGGTRNEVKPQALDFRDPYQQFEIRRHHGGGFFAKSAAYDGVPPRFLRRKGWRVRAYRSVVGADLLDDALGISPDEDVRATIPPARPGLEAPVGPAILGRWYCPYAFVREEAKIKRHMDKSLLYRVSLEQWWEEIFQESNTYVRNVNGGAIRVNVSVEREQLLVYGAEGVAAAQGGWVWFRARDGAPKSPSVGLSTALVEGMKALQVERGWCDAGDGDRMDVRVDREEDVGRGREWRRFACYVLVEAFCLRRMDGVLIMKHTFRHIHNIRCKWD